MNLFYHKLGEGPPLLILHGLFGSSDNWRTLAKAFSEHRTVFLIDLRNHGQSPHSDEHTYQAMTQDLYEFVGTHALSASAIIGHSMGGKLAMNFAVAYPEHVERLIVVDVSPLPFRVTHDDVLRGLTAMERQPPQSRNQASDLLARYVPDVATRQLLLKNLTHNAAGQLTWRINVPTLLRDVQRVGDGMQYEGRFEGPTLFIRGSRSDYINAAAAQEIHRIFPLASIVAIEAGHWVHTENPAAFVSEAVRFLDAPL